MNNPCSHGAGLVWSTAGAPTCLRWSLVGLLVLPNKRDTESPRERSPCRVSQDHSLATDYTTPAKRSSGCVTMSYHEFGGAPAMVPDQNLSETRRGPITIGVHVSSSRLESMRPSRSVTDIKTNIQQQKGDHLRCIGAFKTRVLRSVAHGYSCPFNSRHASSSRDLARHPSTSSGTESKTSCLNRPCRSTCAV